MPGRQNHRHPPAKGMPDQYGPQGHFFEDRGHHLGVADSTLGSIRGRRRAKPGQIKSYIGKTLQRGGEIGSPPAPTV
jgi:hypothetical protein